MRRSRLTGRWTSTLSATTGIVLVLASLPGFERPALAGQIFPRAASYSLADAFSAADTLRAEWKEPSFKAALSKYYECRRLADANHDLRAEALALKSIGEIHFVLGRIHEAQQAYRTSLSLTREANDRRLLTDVLNGLGEAEIDEDIASAQKRFEEARAISEADSYSGGLAQALSGLGVVSGIREKQPEALDLLGRALSLFTADEDQLGQSDVLRNMGDITSDLGDRAKALEYFKSSAEKAAVGRDPRREALAQSAIGLMNTALGELERSREAHDRAIKAFTEIGDQVNLGLTLNTAGLLGQELGDYRYALKCYERSLAVARQTHERRREAEALGLLGRLYEAVGDPDVALANYRKRLRISLLLGDRRQQAYALEDMGSIYAKKRRFRTAVACYRRSIRVARKLNHPRVLAYAINNLARTYHLIHRYSAAAPLYKKALELMNASGDQRGLISVTSDIARLKRDRGDLDGAIEDAQRLISMVESRRSTVASSDRRASYLASVYSYYEFYVDLLMRKHNRNPNLGLAAAAFEQSERGRARSLIELLARACTTIREDVDQKLLDHERDLELLLGDKARREIDLRTKLYRLQKLRRDRPGDSATEAGIADALKAIGQLEEEVESLRNELQGVEADINRASPASLDIKTAAGVSVEAVQRDLLDSDSIALEYSLGDDRSHLWVITSDSFRTFELPRRSTIERACLRLLAEISNDPRGPERTRRRTQKRGTARNFPSNKTCIERTRELGRLVIPAQLAEGLAGKRLVVIADGALQYIPFGVLIAPGENSFLCEGHDMVTEPSLSALVSLRERLRSRPKAPQLLALFADPVFERGDPRNPASSDNRTESSDSGRGGFGSPRSPSLLPGLWSKRPMERGNFMASTVIEQPIFRRLNYAGPEAVAIESLASGQYFTSQRGLEANKKTCLEMDLSQYQIIHFATHSLLDFSRPELSCIVLSQIDERGEPQDGFLRLRDIYNMKLRAELVVLSACQTAVGREVRGEGLVSLTRGFMYAGAARVVASLWKVDDEASTQLMTNLYERMIGHERLSPARALREAQKQVMSDSRWRHPYFWAAFVTQGEWR